MHRVQRGVIFDATRVLVLLILLFGHVSRKKWCDHLFNLHSGILFNSRCFSLLKLCRRVPIKQRCSELLVVFPGLLLGSKCRELHSMLSRDLFPRTVNTLLLLPRGRLSRGSRRHSLLAMPRWDLFESTGNYIVRQRWLSRRVHIYISAEQELGHDTGDKFGRSDVVLSRRHQVASDWSDLVGYLSRPSCVQLHRRKFERSVPFF